MSMCLPILMEAVCVLNMILLMEANLSMTKEEEMGHVKVFTYPGGRDGVTQHDPDHLGLLSACGPGNGKHVLLVQSTCTTTKEEVVTSTCLMP